MNNPYWEHVCEIADRQRLKGIGQYGQGIEENDQPVGKKVDMAIEELVDLAMYLEWVKDSNFPSDANNYQKLAARTINNCLMRTEQEKHALFGMASEIGEIQGLYQKRYQGHPMDYMHLKKEVGDLLWFIAEYCTVMEWDLLDVMDLNINKLRERYPDGFDAEKSLNRKEGDV